MNDRDPKVHSEHDLVQQIASQLMTSERYLIMTLDLHGSITYVNKRVEKVMGYHPGEMIGRPWGSFFEAAGDWAHFPRVLERILSGRAARVQTSFRTKGGEEELLYWDSHPFTLEGRNLRQVLVIGDLVAQNEESPTAVPREWRLLTDIVNNVGAGLNLLDQERRILWTNSQMRRWFGEEYQPGCYCYEALHEPDHSKESCPTFYTFQTKKTGSVARWIETADGKRRFFQFITTPILDEASRVTQVLELITDITTRKETEERRVESERLATIGELASAVAHEIRNPMTVIGGFARRLKRKIPDNALVQETADVILSESRRLEDMVHKVNQFLNPREKNLTMVHIGKLMSQTLNVMALGLRDSSIEVKADLGHDIPSQMIDRNKIHQVFYNILQNAIDAMPGGGTIKISTNVVGEFVEVRIQDTGPGIEEEDSYSIFHAFFSRKPEGLGLGLTIAYQIIHEHGGYISAERGPGGHGALFIVGIPLYANSAIKGHGGRAV